MRFDIAMDDTPDNALERLTQRIGRVEEKLAFLEHDMEQLDSSIREMFDHLDGLKRTLTGVQQQVQSNTQQIAEGNAADT